MSVVNSVCPKCFEKSDKVVYVCHAPGCEKAGEPQTGVETPGGAPISPTPRCAACGGEVTSRLCSKCSYPLPADSSVPYLPFMITGATGSGKSSYISVLIHRIRQDLCRVYGSALYPLGGDATMQLYDRLYHHPIFVQGRTPSVTEIEDIEPLGYSLVFSGQKPAGRTCNLALYDSSGGTFESERTALLHNRGLTMAAGILLMVDPSQLAVSREHLMSQHKPVLDVDIIPLLARLIHIIRTSGGMQDMQKKIDIPIAVCLTRVDAVDALLDPSSFVRYPSRHLLSPCLDSMDLESCSLEVQSLFESWGGRELVNQIWAQFEHYSFFAVSSLGSQPKGTHIHRVSSHRVLDPFLWLLWKNRIIECRKVQG